MKEELLKVTKELGIKVIYLVNCFNNPFGWARSKQIVRCTTPVVATTSDGANYRAVYLANSKIILLIN